MTTGFFARCASKLATASLLAAMGYGFRVVEPIAASRAAMPTNQIALQVGYNDAGSFSRLFRERMGLSPGAYRSRYQSVEAGIYTNSRSKI